MIHFAHTFQCPPCKAFTPMLRDAYEAINKDEKKFEVIFVSSDQTEDAFKEYFGTMPFLALPYNSEIKEVLSDYFEVEGTISLLTLKTCVLISYWMSFLMFVFAQPELYDQTR